MNQLDPNVMRDLYGEPEVAVNPMPQARKLNPQDVARGVEIQKKTGVDAILAAQRLPEFQDELDQDYWNRMVKDSPKTAKFMAASPVNAALLQKDADSGNLGMLEAAFKPIVAAAKYVFSAPDTKNTLAGDLGGGWYKGSGSIYGVVRAGAELAAPVLDPLAGTILPENPLRRLAAGAEGQAKRMNEIGNYYSPPAAGIVQGGVSAGVQSAVGFGKYAPLLALGPAGGGAALAGMVSETFGSSYTQARDKGMAPIPATTFAVPQAVIEYATEKIPMSKLIGDIAANATLRQTLVQQLKTEIPGEQVATLLQDLNEWAVLNPEKPFKEYLAERPNAAAQTLIATAVGVGGNVALSRVVSSTMDKSTMVEARAQEAQQHAQLFEDIQKTAAATEVLGTNAETLTAYMQDLADEGVPNVYVDSTKLVEAGVDLQALAQTVPSIAAQLEQIETGGDLVIPTGELLAATVGTEFAQPLIDNARTDVNGMSRAEAQVYMQEKGDQVNAEIAQVLAAEEQDAEFKAGRDEVQAEILSQLNEVKRFTPRVNENYALLTANFYAVMAARSGMTVRQFADVYKLGFKSESVAGGMYDQGGQLATESDAFKNWFADSKVVDAEGKPLVVYHGTAKAFTEFDQNKTMDGAFWFTSDKAALDGGEVGAAASGDVMPVYLSAKRLAGWEDYESKTYDQLIAEGFDGIKLDNDYVIFDPTQIKSVFNRGTFDPNDANILNQDGQAPKLMAVHNLSIDNLLYADKIGGLAVPSVGVVTDQAGGVEGFGEITLIGRREMVDPKSERVFSSDAYTVRFPRPEYPKAKSKDAMVLVDKVRAVSKEFDDRSLVDTTFDSMVNTPKPDEVVSKWLRSNATKALYLREQGVDVAPVMSPVRLESGLTVEQYTELRPLFDQAMAAGVEGSPQEKELQAKIEAMLRENYKALGKRDVLVDKLVSHAVNQYEYVMGKDARAIEAGPQVDSGKTSEALDAALKGKEAEFKAWAEGQIMPKFGEPFLKVGSKKLPYTLPNIVDAMTDSKVKGKEKTMTYGPGQVRAAASVEFSNLEQMREAAKESIADPEVYKAAKEQSEKLLSDYREAVAKFTTIKNWRGEPDIWEAMDGSMRALAKWATSKKQDATSMKSALRGEDFNTSAIPAEIIDQAMAAGRALLDAPVPYFEAKPQRAVNLDEFAGAVLPAYAPKEVLDVLAKNGIATKQITADEDRTQAAKSFAAELSAKGEQTLFQEARGQIAFGKDITQQASIISLLKGADLSTFIHEGGHFFLEVQTDLANRITTRIAAGEQVSDGERSILNDMNSTLRWMGVTGDQDLSALDQWAMMGVEEKRPYHEKWARGFEAYAFEGKSPSLELTKMFQTFRAWLVNVYRNLKKMVDGGAGKGNAFEQPAFHGTPHRGIDKFSTDKIGTGEGAQAYGWGLYFASKREIAEHYRQGLSYREVVRQFRDALPDDADFDEALSSAESGDLPKPMADVIKALAADDWLGFDYPSQAITATFKELDNFDASDALRTAARNYGGQLYEVEIPEDDTMLLWDKPLSEQPEAVRKVLEGVYSERAVNPDGMGMGGGAKILDNRDGQANADSAAPWVLKSGDSMYDLSQKEVDRMVNGESGENIYTRQVVEKGSQQAASEFLAGLGIKGIKYLDGTSRSQGEGSYNYVVFSGDDVAIKNQFYQSPAQIADTLDVELTDEVRAVMDRMLATTEQIQEAEAARAMGPLFQTPEQGGMTLDEFKAYHDQGTQATQDAIQELQGKGLRDMQWLRNARSRKLKELQKQHNALRKRIEADVRADVLSQPLYRAWTFLTSKQQDKVEGTKPVGNAKGINPEVDNLFTAIAKLGGLDRAQVKSQWGIDEKEKLDSGVFGAPVVRKTDGLSLDAMAERLVEYGYMLPDENGSADLAKFEELFDDQRRGTDRYSIQRDMAATYGDAPMNLPDLPEVGFGKLRTDDLRRMYGSDDTAIWRKLSKLRMTSDEIGMDADVVAELFEFSSGDELVRALADAEPPKSVIEGMTDQRMLEEHGDLATPAGLERAADAAIHNEARVKFVATELAALQKASSVREKVPGKRHTVDVLARAAREYATEIIARLKVREVRPHQYAAAEARAARAAIKATGDLEKQTLHKRNQLINLYATRAAYQAQDDVAKALEYFKKFDKTSPALDADYADQIHALLERFDLRKATSLKAIDKRKSLVQWVESQREQGLEPDIPDGLLQEAYRKSVRDMTVEEVRGLYDTVKQIEHLGRLKGKLLTAQENRDFAAAVDEITTSIDENAKGRTADTRTPNTLPALALQSLKNFWASHIKVATWARVMDGGKDGGAVWEYMIRTANIAGDTEVVMREKATKELAKLVAPVLKEGEMGGKGQFFPTIQRSLNKEARLAIALNMGNAGNEQRLLGGERWTIDQIRPVLDSLSAADWQFVQSVWDHFETYRPQIAAKERRIYGKEPNWVEPVPVQTPFGVLRGGYYPVKYDTRASVRAEEHADAEAARQQLKGAYTSATTRRSFTKARAEEVNGRPLLYSLDGIYNGVQEVIHDLTWHEWLIDTNKLLKNKAVDGAIRNSYGPDVVRQFKSWVEDNATGDRGAQNAGELAAAWLRQGVSVSGLGLNVMSALMQPLGITQSIVRIGPKWVGKGIAQAIGSPLETADAINEKSEFMRTRALTRLREIAEVRSQVKGVGKTRRAIDSSAYFLMMRAQQLVDIPTWWGAYEKATAEGNDENRSVALADQAVIDAQGSGTTKDLSAIERGGPVSKLFTVFYSFFNTALNLGVGRTMTADNKAKLAADYILLFTVPAILGAVLKDAMTAGDSGDWEDPESILKKLAGEQLSFLMGLMVGVREFTAAAQALTGTQQYAGGYQGPAGVRMIVDAYKLALQTKQGELDDGLRKAVVNAAGDLLRLPAAQINRTITGAQALADGKTENPGVLLTGYQEP